MTLTERTGLHDLARPPARVPASAGSNAQVTVAAVVAGMVAGADTIAPMDLLRHGGMGAVVTAGRAPSTLGTFLRSFTAGHVGQLDAVTSRVLVNLPARAPLLVGADQVAYLDTDDTITATYGYAKQGAGRLVTDALVTAPKAGATGQVTVRADSACDNHDGIAAVRTAGARFSVTARMDPAVTRAITPIPEDARVGITYSHAIDDRAGRAVLGLAPPGRVRRLGRVDARRRGHPP